MLWLRDSMREYGVMIKLGVFTFMDSKIFIYRLGDS